MISPEIIAEQVMGYVVGAAELIPTLKQSQNKEYSVAIIPHGPHFYTGLLQAGGYLLLDHQRKDMLVISEQQEDPNHILIDTENMGPVLGKIRKTPKSLIDDLTDEIGARRGDKGYIGLSEELRMQLPFIRAITETKELMHISIGKKISKAALDRTLHRMTEHSDRYNIVFLKNIEISTKPVSGRSDEQKKIDKIIRTASERDPLLYLFKKVLHTIDKEHEIIAYVNPKDFGRSGSSATRYICAMG